MFAGGQATSDHKRSAVALSTSANDACDNACTYSSILPIYVIVNIYRQHVSSKLLYKTMLYHRSLAVFLVVDQTFCEVAFVC